MSDDMKRERYNIGYAIDENGNKRPLKKEENERINKMLDKCFKEIDTPLESS